MGTRRPIEGRKVDPSTWPERLPFPHNTTEESIVLRRFIEANILKGEWWFDVKLPSMKAEFVKNLPEPWATMWKNLTAKRIDALCFTGRAWHIIEVKRQMLASGIGQLKLYDFMFKKYYQPEEPVHLWYVTFYHDPDVVLMCEREEIKTWWLI
ncbi:MAG: hypothetical protein J7J51_05235 [Candidatus Omnitrophica bacterium]|nr:hypothetical protein [Candidatus Omnitrophota bacterium]